MRHASKEVYVKGNIHTNTIDGTWSWVKRGINGGWGRNLNGRRKNDARDKRITD